MIGLRIFKAKRYFVCFYSFSIKNGQSWGSGSMDIINNAGEYFSAEWTINEVTRGLMSERSVDRDQISVTITNMVELSRRDWLSYTKRESSNTEEDGK